ncbi:MAG: VacJ family lipoprotein [Proteobacteria bacterium]|nr:VacJ family lipoprotein [Pseudomonadota bacterium]
MTHRLRALVVAIALLAGLAATGLGCATPQQPDPYEGINRRIFSFNEGADRWLVEPVAIGWNFVLPRFVQERFADFFDLTGMPVVLLNDLLQGKGEDAAMDVVRVITNLLFGFGGFYDTASWAGVPLNDEDFGQTLGSWGVPAGAYLMIPLLGPTTTRELAGFAVDTASTPWGYLLPGGSTVIVTIVRIVNFRSMLLEEVRQNRRDSFDYYVFLRSAFLQNRQMKVEDRKSSVEVADEDRGAESEDDLYYFEDKLELDLDGE